MHDPLTVAFEIKYPWWEHKPWPKKFRHQIDRKFIWEHRMSEKDKAGRDSHWDEGYKNTAITKAAPMTRHPIQSSVPV